MSDDMQLLDTDLGSVDTSMPLLAAGIYEMKVEKANIVETNDKAGKMLALELSTTTPAKTATNDDVGAGVRVFDQRLFTPKGKMTNGMIVRSIGEVVQAAKLSGVTIAGIESWHKQLEGRVLKTRVSVDPERTKDGQTYRARNSVSAFLKN